MLSKRVKINEIQLPDMQEILLRCEAKYIADQKIKIPINSSLTRIKIELNDKVFGNSINHSEITITQTEENIYIYKILYNEKSSLLSAYL
jgi:hypothetical protein